MATKQKELAAGKEIKRGASPMGSSSSTHRKPRPSTPPGTSVAKDQAKTQAPSKSSTTARDHPSKHVPNYLKPTISSKTDVGKQAVSKKPHSHDDMHKHNTTTLRRRSFEKPVPASQIHKAIHPSPIARGDRVANAPVTLKNNNSAAKPAASLERVSKVVKAVKCQPPLVKTKSLPKQATSRKEAVKTNGLKKASSSKEEEEEEPPSIVKSEAEEQESLDLNVEEELARMESPGGPDLVPPEKHLENVDDENDNNPAAHVDDANQEKLKSAEEHKEDQEHENEMNPVDKNTDIDKVSNKETAAAAAAVNESQRADEIDQQRNGAVDEAPAEDDTKKEEDKTEEEIKLPVELTVKTTPDEVAEGEEQGMQISRGEDEKQSAKSESATSVVHKRQTGGPINKKESPAYNDVIEETASKLVEKRVNKVRALAGAFETVISLEQPHSS